MKLLSSVNIKKIILNEKQRQLFMGRAVYLILGLVSTVMTVVNIATHKDLLMISTLAFSVMCFVNLGLTYVKPRGVQIANTIFQVEFLMLCTFFLVSGTPEGFSAFWTPMIPAAGIFLWGLRRGLINSAIMLLIVMFFCWVPAGRACLQYGYTQSFLLRFPFLYTAYCCVATLLGGVLFYVQNSYNDQSRHDPLTLCLNRAGFSESIQEELELGKAETVGFLIMDLDFFKLVNDTYGHNVGDKVLIYAVEQIRKVCPYPICRWGGEEFAIYCKDGEVTGVLAERIVRQFQSSIFTDGTIRIQQNISVGGVVMSRKKVMGMDEIGKEADIRLYYAKQNGRNQARVENI